MKIQLKKKTEIIDVVEYNHKVPRRVFQSLFVDISDSFIEFIHSLSPDKIQELDDDTKTNGWGVKSMLEVENAYKLLTIFQMFYYLNGGFPLTNGLLIVPDGEVPEGEEKINLKQLSEMFKDTTFHGLASFQFLRELRIFFGVDISLPESTITELYKNLSHETLKGARDLDFQAVSNLISEISFQIKLSNLLNRKRKEEDNESNLKITKERDFFECSKKLHIPMLNLKFRMLKQ